MSNEFLNGLIIGAAGGLMAGAVLGAIAYEWARYLATPEKRKKL
jgi:hypothetical protein